MRARSLLGRILAASAAAILCASPPSPAAPSPSEPAAGAPIQITIAAVGDVIPHDRIVDSARDRSTGAYDFWPIFAPIAPYLTHADYAIANLETTLAGPATGYSGYPLFNAPVELAEALKLAGIDFCATANNHCLDRGWSGLVATLGHLDEIGLAHAGTNRSLTEKRTPFVADVRGIKVGLLVYTEALNGHVPPREHDYAVNRLNVDAIAVDAAMARLYGAEIVIAVVHWGNEYQRYPAAGQARVAEGGDGLDAVLARGVDVIIGHHPHVVQPLVWAAARDAYVAYSLGNFLSNQPWRYTDSGLVAYVHIEKTGIRAHVTGISYLPVYVQRGTSRYPTTYRVLPVLPGRAAQTDIPLTKRDETRMDQVWNELEPLLYRPSDNIRPLDPAGLGL